MQKNKITLDSRQQEIVEQCREIALSIKPITLISKIKTLFYKRSLLHGIYLYGSVGRGKTILMKMFYEQVLVSKEIIHFQKFMQDLHIKLHKLQAKSAHRVIQDLANDIASRSQVVCMDEFEIKDITDAMIIMRLFEQLAKCNVFIFLTTNIIPDNLYLDGLQRESFLPFITALKHNFQVIHLDTDKDYRYTNLSNLKERVLYPSSIHTHTKMQKIKKELCQEKELYEANIEIFGRNITFKFAYQNILFTNFKELFERDLGYTDYVAICEHFKIIILESVRPITEDEVNIITRFINFIDNAYFYKILLFIELEIEPDQIYKKGKRREEFVRTISRLTEMNSDRYLSEDK